jgi:predicted acetyltransferase
MPIELDFRRPARTDREAFADWIADWRGDGYDAYHWIFARAWTDFDWYVTSCERMRIEGSPPELTVPLDVFWAFAGQRLAGELYLFYEPMEGDNHIGYKVRPSLRRKGVAGALLGHGLERMRERGIDFARLSCRETNAASAAVIERAGGTRIADRHLPSGHVNRRYLVPTR